ncbi:flagellar protein FliS [Deferribacter desulfuricans SSM1]|uniref:Flagellar secretion chaperone FliS n=1 Tax=Deferribacter desulfuricans (strain DSM 14783 / JCM 11476 / NBRC 101012 / SSM1) TaxID=639282 RepID=D3PBU1_DEFDS|nr:flagellar export chaperone FliS [Deferribacter desulfuricans]BAI80064.1 flagellar protein FliS [Deferribacter desulfuricans SSM1]
MKNPIKTYLKNEIEGATKGKLVLLLYDGTIKYMKLACKYIDEKNIPEAHMNIVKAENIIYELMSTLNMEEGGEIAENLLKLYDFMVYQLIMANKDKDKSKIESVIKLMMVLREGWKQIVEKEEKADTSEVVKKKINISG